MNFYKLIFFAIFTLVVTASADEWSDKMAILRQVPVPKETSEDSGQHQTRQGMEFYDVNFIGDPTTPSVHKLRPQDISVIGALGDSITAANGAGANALPGVINTYVGLSWSVGGDGSTDDVMTLTNILRHFNPDLKGFSTGIGADKDSFNVAVPGARAKNMPKQARDLINRMKNSSEINYENDWKVVTIFIGGNDLCSLLDESSTPENYIAKLEESLDVLHAELPRALINVVEMLEIYLLPQVAHGYGSSLPCEVAQKTECPYVGRANEEELEHVKQETWKYQELTEELISSGKYDTRDDFTVVLQPFFHDTELPYTEDGEVDSTYFAPDCFHFSSKGHGMGAINLWNNMLEPVGEKTKKWSLDDLKVPTKERPFIFTSKNSDITNQPEGGGGTTSNDDCGQVPSWLIAVVAVLAAALFIQAMFLLKLVSSRNKKGDSKFEHF